MLKSIRISNGLSQQALAELSGVNIRQIQKYESGECNPGSMTLKNAIAISDALGIDPRDLMTNEKRE